MNNFMRESDRLLTHYAGSTVRRLASDNDSPVVRKPAGVQVEVYDALDYRLMATFPASDATAQY